MPFKIESVVVYGNTDYGKHTISGNFYSRPTNWQSLEDKIEAAWKQIHEERDFIPPHILTQLASA